MSTPHLERIAVLTVPVYNRLYPGSRFRQIPVRTTWREGDDRRRSVLPILERNTLSLGEDIRLERAHLRVVIGQRRRFEGVLLTPADPVPQERHPRDLDLVLAIGLGMGVGGVGMAHVAAYRAGAFGA